MGPLSRRRFLSIAAATGAAAAVPASLLAAQSSQDFTFLHITDTHLQPELHGVDGSLWQLVGRSATGFP
jgi:Icc protein